MKAIFDGLMDLATDETDTVDIKQLASDFSVKLWLIMYSSYIYNEGGIIFHFYITTI